MDDGDEPGSGSSWGDDTSTPQLSSTGDFYSYLNVSKEATEVEINNAFRRLSKLYHPDKHCDLVKKAKAEKLFNKIKRAHEVLTDAHKRAIYDTLGEKGLETEGWQLVSRTKSPREIREEYELLAREREEKLLQQKTNPKGHFTVTLDGTDMFDTSASDQYSYTIVGDDQSIFPHIEVGQMQISQSIDFPLTMSERVTLGGSLQSRNGHGTGNVTTSFKKTTGHNHWVEVEGSAGSGLLLALRGNISWPQYKSFGNVGVSAQVQDGLLSPGLQAMVAKHFDKHLVGYLALRLGNQSSMTTTVVYHKDANYIYGALQLGVPHSMLHLTYIRRFEERDSKLKISTKLGTFGGLIEYGYEHRVTKHSVLAASITAGVPFGVTLKIRLNRGNQQYACNILLSSHHVSPSAMFYGTVVPVLVYQCVNYLVVQPYVSRHKMREAEELQSKNAEKIAERKAEAQAALSLMQEMYQRVRDEEESKGGVVIVRAWYGLTSSINAMSKSDTNSDGERVPAGDGSTGSSKVVDVTVPLQCLVRSSQLVIYDTPKHCLPGFYDPCPGEEKSVRVVYKFRSQLHHVCTADTDTVRIPKQSHKMSR